MAFGDIDVGEHIVPSAWDADDASVTDATAALNAGTDSWKVVKNNQRLRIQMDGIDPADLTALTIRIVASGAHNPANHAMLAYTDDDTVIITDRIVVDVSGGAGTYDFVADAAFLARLGNLAGDGFAIRITDDNQTSEVTITTAQIEFAAAGGDVLQAQVWM